MALADRLREYIAAAFAGIWVQSCEHEDALAEIARLAGENNWPLAVWDIDRGLQVGGQTADQSPDPVAAVRSAAAMAPQSEDGSALLVLANFHRFIDSAEVVQALAAGIAAGKANRTFIVVLAPVVNIPVELEKQFVVIEHELPDRGQLAEIARSIATEEGELPTEDGELAQLLDASAGLTRYEAEGAYSLSLVRHGRLTPEAVWELKTAALTKSGLLTLHRGGETFADLGGLAALKAFASRALQSTNRIVRPRGVMLLGVPGTGKSAFAKALGNETGRPTLVLDVGALMGSLVGETEGRVRRALQIVDAMAPAVCFIDEVEKALAGVASSGQTDSGVSARLFASMLTWLNDHTSDVFVVCTCNDISRLPPEFARAERFDGIFFLDLPDEQQREAIWRIYLRKFSLTEQDLPEGTDWTGAEIRSCCRLAALLDVSLVEAATHVVPVAATAAESVGRLRTWASGRCLNADAPGIYVTPEQSGQSTRRRTQRQSRN